MLLKNLIKLKFAEISIRRQQITFQFSNTISGEYYRFTTKICEMRNPTLQWDFSTKQAFILIHQFLQNGTDG